MHSETITVHTASSGEIQQWKCLEFNTHSLKASKNNVYIVNEFNEPRSTVKVVWLTITFEECLETERLIFYILHNWTASEDAFSYCTLLLYVQQPVCWHTDGCQWEWENGMLSHSCWDICKAESYPEDIWVSGTKQENYTSIPACKNIFSCNI